MTSPDHKSLKLTHHKTTNQHTGYNTKNIL